MKQCCFLLAIYFTFTLKPIIRMLVIVWSDSGIYHWKVMLYRTFTYILHKISQTCFTDYDGSATAWIFLYWSLLLKKTDFSMGFVWKYFVVRGKIKENSFSSTWLKLLQVLLYNLYKTTWAVGIILNIYEIFMRVIFDHVFWIIYFIPIYFDWIYALFVWKCFGWISTCYMKNFLITCILSIVVRHWSHWCPDLSHNTISLHLILYSCRTTVVVLNPFVSCIKNFLVAYR